MTPTALSPAERVAWLRLARSEAVGPVTFARLLERYGGPQPALAALPALARRGGRGAAPQIPTEDQARAELEAGAAAGARLICAGEADFPLALAAVDPPPPLLWALGDAALLQRPTIAIVGARVASAAGRRFAQTLAAELGRAGWAVVSGMARGIDAAAHEGSLATGAVAAMAGGVDSIYPPENAPLHAAIAAQGCLVSERAMGHVARAQDFPRRNRIISGLSRGVVVVEAELRSGSLITARLAGEQGREVFAVPGSPLDPRSRGANDLIRQGATLVEDAGDVLRVLEALPGLRAPEPDVLPPPSCDAAPEGAHAVVMELLSPTPTSLDQLARASGLPSSAVAAAVMELALAGRAEFVSGNLAVSA